MDTARYRAFLAAAELGSLTRAAEELNYTPSGVSQLIHALERELDIALLNRSRNGVIPTEAATRLLPVVRGILQQEEQLYQLAAQANGLQIGSVSIASYFSIATHWLPKVIGDFQRKYPHIEIKLIEGTRREIAQRLDSRQADLAFISYQEPMQYQWLALAEEAMMAILPKSHPLAGEKAYPLSRCAQDRFIMPERGEDDDVLAILRQNGVHPNICFSTRESFAVIPLVEQGIGISIINELLTTRWQCDVQKLPLDPPQKVRLGIAAVDFRRLSPAAERFWKFAAQQLRQQSQSPGACL